MAAALLLAALLAAGWARRWIVIPGGSAAPSRSAAYRLTFFRHIAGFALPALAGLWLAGQQAALATMPPSFALLAARLGIAGRIDGGDYRALLVGTAIGSAVGGLLAVWRWRKHGRRGPMFGELGWLLPRGRRDLAWGVALSLAAGIAEELYFRLAIPLLVTLASGSALLGFLVAIVLFGAAHRYQGRAGVVVTTIAGALFAALYLASGELLLAMAAHVVVDLNSLVLAPALTGAWKRA